jgi:hypothetical protein
MIFPARPSFPQANEIGEVERLPGGARHQDFL